MADNIFQRMQKITAEVSTVAKNLEVGFGSSKYKAVGEADILRAVKPIEEKYGVYSYPYDREIVESGTMEREGRNGKTIQLYLRVKTIYRFVCVDDPTSYLDIVSYGDGVDTQDKAPGKAMTYSDKYALMKAYKIQTGDDPTSYIDIVSYGDGVDTQDKAPGKAMTYSDKYALMKAYKIQTGDDPDQYASEPQSAVNTQMNQRRMMEQYVLSHYDSENLAKMLAYYNAKSVADLDSAQLAMVYSRKLAQEGKK